MDQAIPWLLKAIRSLPEHEQDTVLAYLLDRALVTRDISGAQATPAFFGPRAEAWRSSTPWPRWGASLFLLRLAAGMPVGVLASEFGVDTDVLRAALRDLARRTHRSDRLAGIFEKLAEEKTTAEAASELGLTQEELLAELEPTDALTERVCAALMARTALSSPAVPYVGASARGPLRTMPVRFPEAQYQRLKEWCQEHGFSMAVVVRGLVERFLDAQQRPTA
jgi:hypothetical protein